MIKNQIGENAGKIWRVLAECGESTIKELKVKTEMNDTDLYLALGWLSREDKIVFNVEGNDAKISLAEL